MLPDGTWHKVQHEAKSGHDANRSMCQSLVPPGTNVFNSSQIVSRSFKAAELNERGEVLEKASAGQRCRESVHMFGMSKWIQPITALAFAVSIVTFAGAARAFEPGNCNDLSSRAVTGFNTFRVDAGKADFGDEIHFLGAPQGDAVICWFSGGRVGVEGKVFADSFSGEPVVATAEIRYTRTNGQATVHSFAIGTNISWVASRLVRDRSPRGNFNRVRIRLFTFLPLSPTLPSTLVFSRTFHR
jgi:hypothetical protein